MSRFASGSTVGGCGVVTLSPAGVHGPLDEDAGVYVGIIGGMPGGLTAGSTRVSFASGSEGSAASALAFLRNVMAISATMVQPRNFALQDSTAAARLPK